MLRCLIVDDNQYFLSAARCLLEHQGITVVGLASDSAEALRLAERLRPDVTLVDIDLGIECGLELAGRLRSAAGPPPLPVILISSHAEEDYADLIEASPATGFVGKTVLSGDAIRAVLAAADAGGRAGPEGSGPKGSGPKGSGPKGSGPDASGRDASGRDGRDGCGRDSGAGQRGGWEDSGRDEPVNPVNPVNGPPGR
ncbi:response regulator transcription factor [Streptomyces sp. NPDC048514]|uniref:response regulator n=1 Tax=Streptomyces sp. NPDC048514 TaxID=3365564 RepID=UPI00371DA9C1